MYENNIFGLKSDKMNLKLDKINSKLYFWTVLVKAFSDSIPIMIYWANYFYIGVSWTIELGLRVM